MKITIKKNNNTDVLLLNEEDEIVLQDVSGNILEDFVDAALEGKAELVIKDNLEEHPISNLFKELKEIEDENHEVNKKIKEIEEKNQEIKNEMESDSQN